MIAIDTNILTEVMLGNVSILAKLRAIPALQQALPVVVVEEVIRGRLNVIRQAEAGRAKVSIDRAYQLFQETFEDFRGLQVLPYTSPAEIQFQQWRKQKIPVSTHDLRIAAICIVHEATLISRNRQDFSRVPGLSVEYWD